MKTTYHALERTQERIIDLNVVDVSHEIHFGGQYRKVGTIRISQETKDEFTRNLKTLQGMNVGSKNMVVQLTRFDLRNSNIDFTNKETEEEAKGKSLTVQTEHGNGDIAYAFVVKGVLVTIITVRHYQDITKKFKNVTGQTPIIVKNINKFRNK